MTIRLRLEPCPLLAFKILPPEILFQAMGNLDLISLSIVRLVCKIWYEVSSDRQLWESVAYRKGIYLDGNSPIQAAVISTFKPYCEAARKIFSLYLVRPAIKNSMREKQSLDAEIAKMDKSQMDPIQSLVQHLKILSPQDNLVEKFHSVINECIPMIQVWIEAEQLTVDESLLHALNNSSLLVKLDLVLDTLIHEAFASICDLLNQEKNELDFQDFITTIQRLLDGYSTLTQYILHFVEKPSPAIIKNLCYLYAVSQCIEVWKNLANIRFEKRDSLNLLLENLTGNNREQTFEQFMLNEGVDVNVKIHFPSYIQQILKKMDETDFQNFKDSLPTHPVANSNIFIQYMVKQIRKNHLDSLISTRTC